MISHSSRIQKLKGHCSSLRCQNCTVTTSSTTDHISSSGCSHGLLPSHQTSVSAPWVVNWENRLISSPETFLVFRFLTGFSSSAFFSVAAGSISDIFHIEEVATYVLTTSASNPILTIASCSPMGMYTLSPFVGPVLGPVVSGFIVQVSSSVCFLCGLSRPWPYTASRMRTIGGRTGSASSTNS